MIPIKALDVLNFDQVEPGAYEPTQLDGDGQRRELIGECAYFRTERFELAPGAPYAGECDGVTFEIWGVLEGNASLEGEWGTIQLDAVAWVLLPVELGAYTVKAIAPLTAPGACSRPLRRMKTELPCTIWSSAGTVVDPGGTFARGRWYSG